MDDDISSKSNGSYSSDSGSLSSRPASVRRPRSQATRLSSQSTAVGQPESTAELAQMTFGGVVNDTHESGAFYNEQSPLGQLTQGQFEQLYPEYSHCSRCLESLNVPCTTFRLFLDTGELVTTHKETACFAERVHCLLKLVNALLNDCGGIVCVHCSVFCPVALLDNVIDYRLNGQIASGTSYEENFERNVLDRNHIVYRVKPSSDHRISILDFHSYLCGNQGLGQPSQFQIQTIIHNYCLRSSELASTEDGYAADMPVPAFEYQRPIQISPTCRRYLLPVDDQMVQTKHGESYGAQLTDYCWEDLGLARYIAALCKKQLGGSVCLGIREQMTVPVKKWTEVQNCDLGQILGSTKKVWVDTSQTSSTDVHLLAREEDVPVSETHGTGVYICQGVELDKQDQKDFKTALMNKIRSEMLWYPEHPISSPVKVKFHPVSQSPCDSGAFYVVEVVVARFYGVAFHNKTGPEAYTIRDSGLNHSIRPVTLEEIMSRDV